MAIRKLRIPKSQEDSFVRLMTMSSDAAQGLAKSLAECKPTFSVKNLATQALQHLQHPLEGIEELLSVLVSLSITAYRAKVSVEDVARDAVESAVEGQLLPKSEREEIEALSERLVTLLRAGDALEVTSKARSLLTRHERTFAAANILSDVRAVFAGDDDPIPTAMMVVHNLELEFHMDGEQRSHFFALDSIDLGELRDVIGRAIKKEDALEKVIQDADVRFLPVDPE